MKQVLNLPGIDAKEVPRYTYDEATNSIRVTIVGNDTNQVTKYEYKGVTTDSAQANLARIEKIEIPTIVKEYEKIEMPVILREIEKIEVPVIIKEYEQIEKFIPVIEYKIIEIEKPIVVKEQQIVEIKVPQIIKEYEKIPSWVKVSFLILLGSSLLVNIITLIKK